MSKATKELKARTEVPEDLTWRLEDIFASDDAWEDHFWEKKNKS